MRLGRAEPGAHPSARGGAGFAGRLAGLVTCLRAAVRQMFQIQPELLSAAQETSGKFSPGVWESTFF